ncbi:hypothetical protein Drose_24480 [Dactylosporangium roseum]|uniref:Membrane transporter protein n=1 Tax=Dactylosporangium roseum TaxID=47989 RepID=A0ABY5Z1K4_9ACTN|nr:hypothetical protein [Dactylosporangium roseum]UWZ34379.1 hypothetical protein Drose_24480 [Dactylosporangium roseum]
MRGPAASVAAGHSTARPAGEDDLDRADGVDGARSAVLLMVTGSGVVAASVEMTSSTLSIGAVAVPAMVLGWIAGDRVSRRMDQTWTRRAVIALLAVGAVLAAVTA